MIIKKFKFNIKKLSILCLTISFLNTPLIAQDEKINAIVDQIQIISEDLKTHEKAVYKKSHIAPSRPSSSNNLHEDISTKHLLKLNGIEDQFRS